MSYEISIRERSFLISMAVQIKLETEGTLDAVDEVVVSLLFVRVSFKKGSLPISAAACFCLSCGTFGFTLC